MIAARASVVRSRTRAMPACPSSLRRHARRRDHGRRRDRRIGRRGHDRHGESWWQLARRAQREGGKQNNPRLVEADHARDLVFYRTTFRNAPNFHVVLNDVQGRPCGACGSTPRPTRATPTASIPARRRTSPSRTVSSAPATTISRSSRTWHDPLHLDPRRSSLCRSWPVDRQRNQCRGQRHSGPQRHARRHDLGPSDQE